MTDVFWFGVGWACGFLSAVGLILALPFVVVVGGSMWRRALQVIGL